MDKMSNILGLLNEAGKIIVIGDSCLQYFDRSGSFQIDMLTEIDLCKAPRPKR